jgi:N6-L-threonylcarbamoyladenine synthase
MLSLGIESTAHTFGVAIIGDDGRILSDEKEVYTPPKGAGIHPREAARHHAETAPYVLKKALDKARTKMQDISVISYSAGPGLGPCLRIGATMARSLSSFFGIPLVPVHHAVGHLELGCLLTKTVDPIALLVSGGHTMIISPAGRKWRVFGETLDITIGQLIDQFGRLLGYSSPSGKFIEELALKGKNYIKLPYTVKGNDVSFSGLLTYLKRLLTRKMCKEDLALSLQETAFGMLAEVVERALALTEKKEVLVVGGVSANKRLVKMLQDVGKRQEAKVNAIPIEYSGDCGAQIAWPGLLYYKHGFSVGPLQAFVRQSWRLDEVEVPWRE